MDDIRKKVGQFNDEIRLLWERDYDKVLIDGEQMNLDEVDTIEMIEEIIFERVTADHLEYFVIHADDASTLEIGENSIHLESDEIILYIVMDHNTECKWITIMYLHKGDNKRQQEKITLYPNRVEFYKNEKSWSLKYEVYFK